MLEVNAFDVTANRGEFEEFQENLSFSGYLQCIEFHTLDIFQRIFDLFLGDKAVMLRQLFRDVAFVIPLQIIVTFVILDHLNVHVSDAEAEDFVFISRVRNLRDRVLQYIVSNLVVKVVVCVFIESI